VTFDVLVRGGTVVTVRGARRADVAIAGGRITAITTVGAVPDEGTGRVIDAQGLLVLPGVIDVHTHARIPSEAEPDRFFRDSVAAAHGGTTTFLAFDNPGTGLSAEAQRRLRSGIDEWLAATRGESAVDYGLSGVITSQQIAPEKDLTSALEAGIPTFKCFLVYDFGVDEARLRALLRAVRAAGGLLQVHGEDRAMLEAGIGRQLDAGRLQPRFHAASRPPVVEAVGTARAIALAAEVGAPVYLVHVSSEAAVAEISKARLAGRPVMAETCPHYLVLDETRYDLPDEEVMQAVISPPLRSRRDQDVLWASLRDRRLDLVATDHVPDRLAVEKRWTGQPFTEIPNGAPGIETLLPIVYGLGVAAGRLGLERMVEVLAAAPARIFGLRDKGAIAVGKDADLVLLDPAGRRTILAAELHHSSDYTPFEGLEVAGRIRRVMVRGADVVVDGEFVGRRGYGRFVERSLPS
jgi:dihydropyrimidinase